MRSRLEIETFSLNKPDAKPTREIPVEEDKSDGNVKEEAKKVFREIMEEEADEDLKRFHSLWEELSRSPENKEKWEQLKKTCSSLNETAQMFDFNEISELMTSLDDLILNLVLIL